jgi:hypothetical protein
MIGKHDEPEFEDEEADKDVDAAPTSDITAEQAASGDLTRTEQRAYNASVENGTAGIIDPQPRQTTSAGGRLDSAESAGEAWSVEEQEAISYGIDRGAARVQATRAKRGNVIGAEQGIRPYELVQPTLSEHPSDTLTNPRLRVMFEGGRAPQYFDEDFSDILSTWSTPDIEDYQAKAILAGMIDPEDAQYHPGQRDKITRDSFYWLLFDANANGNFWDDQLEGNIASHQEWLVDNPEKDENPWRNFVTPTYLAPDYATLAQTVKSTMSQRLGRDASSAEMSFLTDYLGTADRQQWDAQVQGDRQTQAARAREWDTGDPQGGGTVQGVDALARFDEQFDDRFEGELDHRERVANVAGKRGLLIDSLQMNRSGF